MLRFILAPALPLALLVLACFWGGWWGLAAFVAMTVFASGLDRMLPPAPDETAHLGAQQAHALSVAMGLAHLGILPLGVWALSQGAMSLPAALATVGALGLFMGQIANSTAHELIHRPDRWSRRLGAAVYASMLFGHHASAHRLVHHVHVATAHDPNSAPLGMGFWTFLPQAWIGSFMAGLRAETRLRARARTARGPHPYVLYVLGSLCALALAWALGGPKAVAIWVALSAHAQMQLLLSDYVQHYGLRRVPLGDGRYEPASARHSWNAPHWYSAAMMLNAPRHSDHHQNPGRAFPDLVLDDRAMPMLPRSLPEMATLALMPTLWRRVMDRRARKWASPVDRDSDNAPKARTGLGIA
ncbi:MAG: alkane 1-monooxygenase [Rhodobacteraceae bacterium]|nr:MAG: alkane 1-monooxygenase [Paracoccaceae bacterium]